MGQTTAGSPASTPCVGTRESHQSAEVTMKGRKHLRSMTSRASEFDEIILTSDVIDPECCVQGS